MQTQYKHLFTGSAMQCAVIREILAREDISPVIRNETESGRVAGFAPPVFGQEQLFVHEDEYQKSVSLISDFLGDETETTQDTPAE